MFFLKLVSHLKTARTSNETRVRSDLKPNEPNIRNHVKKVPIKLLTIIASPHGLLTRGSKLLISVQWLELVYEMVTFYRFAKVLEENFDENG